VRRIPGIARVLGALLIAGSALLPWFQLPEAVARGPGLSLAVVGREAPATYVFKIIVVLALVGLGLVAYRVRDARLRRRRAAQVSGATLAFLFFFPHAVMVECPVTSAKASWLHTQHESLTWFGGDVFSLQETKDLDWKNRVTVADVLDEATTTNVPQWSPDAVPFGSLRDLFEWFGYSNSFCQFAKTGWGLALLGWLAVVLASVRPSGDPDERLARDALRSAGLVVAPAVVLALLPAVIGGWEIDRARDAGERGEAALALDRMRLATAVVPILGQTSEIALQRGLLASRLGEDTPEATLYQARVLETQGKREEAETFFASLLSDDAVPGPVRREAARGILRRGIRELNSGETVPAIQSLEAVLAADPCDVKANYVLELAYLRAARFASVADLAVRLRATYRFFRDDAKMSVLASAQENVAYAAYLQDRPAEAHALWQTLGDSKRLDP
jgi:hypothetical protein